MRRAIVLLLTENLCTLLDLCVDYYKSTERNDIKETCASKSFENMLPSAYLLADIRFATVWYSTPKLGSKECIEVCKQVHVGKKLESNQTYVERNSRNFPWHSLSSRGCECLLQPTARLRTPAVAASSRDRDFSHSRPTRTATCGPTVRLHSLLHKRTLFLWKKFSRARSRQYRRQRLQENVCAWQHCSRSTRFVHLRTAPRSTCWQNKSA